MQLTARTLDDVLPHPDVSECHHRHIDRSSEEVWAAFRSLTAGEIRLLGPLRAVRLLPAKLFRQADLAGAARDRNHPVLDLLVREGFVPELVDEAPQEGCASALILAAGRFWSPIANQPVRFEDASAFGRLDSPGLVRVAFNFTCRPEGTGTLLTTETRVRANDSRSRRKFKAYWAIIRGPSGLIRRSWLAAVDRRAHRG